MNAGEDKRKGHVPFHSHIVNWNGEDSGFPNQEEIRKWESNAYGWNGNQRQPSNWELLNVGINQGAYSEKGWIHQGLLDLARHFGVEGQCDRQVIASDIADAIQKGSLCIVSVTKAFLEGENDESGRVLVRGAT